MYRGACEGRYGGQVSQTSQSPRSSQRECCPTVARLLAQAKGSEWTSKRRRGQAAMQRTRRNVVIRAQCRSTGIAPCATGQWQWAAVVRETTVPSTIGKLLCWVLCTSDRGIEAKRRKRIEDLVEGKREEPSVRPCDVAPHCSFLKGVPSTPASPVEVKVSTALCRTGLATGSGCNNFSSIASSARG